MEKADVVNSTTLEAFLYAILNKRGNGGRDAIAVSGGILWQKKSRRLKQLKNHAFLV